jgi:hypothetical protein
MSLSGLTQTAVTNTWLDARVHDLTVDGTFIAPSVPPIFESIQLTNTSDQIDCGPVGGSHNLIISAPQVSGSTAKVTVPDPKATTAKVILSTATNGSSGQTIDGGILVSANGGQSVLNYFGYGQLSSVTMQGIWAAPQTITIYYQRIGTQVTLYFSQVLVNATTATLVISNGFTMPQALQPTQAGIATSAVFSIPVNDNNELRVGACGILSNGTITIYSNSSAGSYGTFSGSSGAGPSGWTPFSVTYLLA